MCICNYNAINKKYCFSRKNGGTAFENGNLCFIHGFRSTASIIISTFFIYFSFLSCLPVLDSQPNLRLAWKSPIPVLPMISTTKVRESARPVIKLRFSEKNHPQMPKSIIHIINGCALCCFSKVSSMPALSFAGQQQPNALFMRRSNLSIKSLLNARNDSVTLIQ